MVRLRPYQEKWLERILSARGKVLVVGATGSGKTVVAAALMNRLAAEGKRVLFVAHRRELVTQCIARLAESGCRGMGAVMSGVQSEPWRPIQVASLLSLKCGAMSGFDVVVIDEAHRATAKTYGRVLKANRGAQIYGLTATPKRLDGRSLGDVFEVIVESDPVSELIRIGAISKPEIWSVHPHDLADVAVTQGDFSRNELSEKVCKVVVFGDVIAHWRLHAGNLRTVVYCVDINHAQVTYEAFCAEGIRAALVTNHTPTRQREQTLERVKTGDIQVIVNVELLTEGWDVPALDCALLLRPTLSETLLLQMCGRVMRGGKAKRPKILDHAGNFTRNGHRPPWEDRVWTLAGAHPKWNHRSRDASQTKVCPACNNTLPRHAKECFSCEHVFMAEQVVVTNNSVVLKPLPMSPRELAKQWLRAGRSYRWISTKLAIPLHSVNALADELAFEDPCFESVRREHKQIVDRVRSGESLFDVGRSYGIHSSRVMHLDNSVCQECPEPTKMAAVRAMRRGRAAPLHIQKKLNLTRSEARSLATEAVLRLISSGVPLEEAQSRVGVYLDRSELFEVRDWVEPEFEMRRPEAHEHIDELINEYRVMAGLRRTNRDYANSLVIRQQRRITEHDLLERVRDIVLRQTGLAVSSDDEECLVMSVWELGMLQKANRVHKKTG
ncbi:MAG: DEAD/DEAH box helicase [Nitrospira sp.]|nr:DEAD/DEAH box helicase [Nitrospira sp.]